MQDLFSHLDPQFPWLKLTDPNDGNGSAKYPTPNVARDKWGLNGFVFFDPSTKINSRLSFGTQYSDVLTSTFGDQATPLSTRYSKTSYFDLLVKTYDITFQANYNFGWQDIVVGDEGFKVDMDILNALLEYDANLGNLSLRPGIYYQETTQNDISYLENEGNGFLNDKRKLNAFSGSLRADYNQSGFRMIGALRAEKYNVNDDIYLPFQITASYNINDKHMIRLNVARANRSPFLADTYANYTWNRDERRFPSTIQFAGQENLKLATVDMYEIGYRAKPVRNIQIDIEAFYSISKDFGYLSPDSVVGNFSLVDSALFNFNHPEFGPIKMLQPVPVAGIPEFVNMSYQNTTVESHQKGITTNMAWVARENLVIKVFGTYQQTRLKNYYPFSTNQSIEGMTMDAGANLAQSQNILGATQTTFFEGAGFDPYPSVLSYSSTRPEATINKQDHKATPSFFGGFSVDYKLFDNKLSMFLSNCFYSEQEFKNQYGTYQIPAKALFSLKASFKMYKENALFINIRNAFNNSNQEFAWMDDVHGLFLAGIDIKF